MQEEAAPLFDKSRSAVKFALNHTRSLYSQPLMTKAANMLARASQEETAERRPASPRAGELSGLDGAAQAGLIYIYLERLTPFQRECLISRCAVQHFPCSCRSACCMGIRPNPEWVESIKKLNDYVRNEMEKQQAKARKKVTIQPQLRRMLIEKHFGRKYVLSDLAEQFGIAENTITTYRKYVSDILTGVEKDGWTAMDSYLSQVNIIGAFE